MIETDVNSGNLTFDDEVPGWAREYVTWTHSKMCPEWFVRVCIKDEPLQEFSSWGSCASTSTNLDASITLRRSLKDDLMGQLTCIHETLHPYFSHMDRAVYVTIEGTNLSSQYYEDVREHAIEKLSRVLLRMKHLEDITSDEFSIPRLS